MSQHLRRRTTMKNASERQASQHRTWNFGVGAWGWRIGDGWVWRTPVRCIGLMAKAMAALLAGAAAISAADAAGQRQQAAQPAATRPTRPRRPKRPSRARRRNAARPDPGRQPHRRDGDRIAGFGQPCRPGTARPAHGDDAERNAVRRAGRRGPGRRAGASAPASTSAACRISAASRSSSTARGRISSAPTTARSRPSTSIPNSSNPST